MNDGTAAQIKQVFATPAITSAPPLPESQMGQSMFDCDSLTQRGFAQLVSVAVGVVHLRELPQHECSHCAHEDCSYSARARASSTDLCRKMNGSTRLKRHLLLVWTADAMVFPIEFEDRLEKVCPITHRPGFAVDA